MTVQLTDKQTNRKHLTFSLLAGQSHIAYAPQYHIFYMSHIGLSDSVIDRYRTTHFAVCTSGFDFRMRSTVSPKWSHGNFR